MGSSARESTADFDLRCYVPFHATIQPRAVALLI